MEKQKSTQKQIIVIDDNGVPRYFFLARNPKEIKLRVIRFPERVALGVARELTLMEKKDYLKKRKAKKSKKEKNEKK